MLDTWYQTLLVQYDGSPARRAGLAGAAQQADVVVMSYEALRADVAWVGAQSWGYCVLDEGHVIRNPKSKLAQACQLLGFAVMCFPPCALPCTCWWR